MSLSQLNRQLEYRQDKRPMLADLRESGCLTADTEITLADGTTVDDRRAVRARRARTSRCSRSTSTCARARRDDARVRERRRSRCSSCASRRAARSTASANHPFLTLDGWVHLDDLTPGARIASSRRRGPAVDPRRDTIPREVWDYIERKGLLVNGHCARTTSSSGSASRRAAATASTSRACRASLMRRIADDAPRSVPRRSRRRPTCCGTRSSRSSRAAKQPVFDATVRGHAQLRRQRHRRAQQHRAGRRRRDVHLPRRVLQPGVRPARPGRDHRRQAPQRPDRHDAARRSTTHYTKFANLARE